MNSVPSGPKARREAPPARSVPVGLDDKQIADVREGRAVPSAARQRRRDLSGAVGFAVGEVDQFVLGEARVEHDIHQPAEPKRLRLRHAGDRLRVEHAVADDPKLAGAQLGDEHAAIREEREAPGLGELLGHDHDADLVLLGGVEHERAVAERRAHDPDRSGRLAPRPRPGAPALTAAPAGGCCPDTAAAAATPATTEADTAHLNRD